MQVVVVERGATDGLNRPDGGSKNHLKLVNELQNLIKGKKHGERKDDGALGKHLESGTKRGHLQAADLGISELLPHLYLCGAGAALPHLLDKLKVSFVINVAPELPDTPLSSVTKPLYLRINILDRPQANLGTHFDEVADLIEEVRQHGGKTLVHCVAGVSRSTSLCIAYLLKYGGMSLREAYQHVKAIRPQIRPNLGFFEQLRQFEKRLLGKSSVHMIFLESLNTFIPDVYQPEYQAMEDYYRRHRKALRR